VLGRSPGFTLTVIATLALAIGANSAVFSAINAVLLKPLPFPNADRLVSLDQTFQGRSTSNVGPARLEEWNELSSTFDALTGYYTEDVADTSGDLPERLRGANVAPRFLDVWGIAPALGRGFGEADHEPGAAPVAMISERYWQRRFESDPSVLDTSIRIGEESYMLVGVMPAGFAFPDRGVDVWVPVVYYPFVLNRRAAWYTSFGRLSEGVTLDQARADLAVVQARLAAEFPETDRDIGAGIEPYKDSVVGAVRGSLWLLFGAVSILLLIACTNIAALLLSRAAQRQQEIAVRLALGSSRWSIAMQTLTETAVLALAGAALGVLVAGGASAALRAVAPDFPRIEELAIDGPVLLYTLLSIVGVTLVCGLAPAIRNARGGTSGGIPQAGRGQVSARHSLQWFFVGVQVALSITLLAGAGLLVRSFQELGRVDPGFEPEGVLTFRVSGSYGEPDETMIPGIERMLDELAGVPGIESAATSSPVPGVANDRSGFEFGMLDFELVDGGGDVEQMSAEFRIVSSNYFATMGIPLLLGDGCRRRDLAQEWQLVVNQAFATRFLAGRAPIGLNLRGGGNTGRIVGVTGDAREFGLDRSPVPTAAGGAHPDVLHVLPSGAVAPSARTRSPRRPSGAGVALSA
jgi:predicted permease